MKNNFNTPSCLMRIRQNMFEFNHEILRTKLNEKMAGVQKRGGEVRYCLYVK